LKDRILKVLLPTVLIAVLLIIWEVLSIRGIVNKALFPAPSAIVEAITGIPHLMSHIFQSLKLLLYSVVVGYSAGFVLGIAMGIKLNISYFEDVLSFFMAIPGISWAPLFIITIGFGDVTIFLVGVITAFFPVVYNIYHGTKEMDPNFLRIARLFEYSKRQKFFIITLPAVMNFALGSLKLSFARTWRTIIAVEMVAASTYGLGFMIFDARELLNTRYMFAGILLSGAIYMAIELVLIRFLEKVTVERWGMKVTA